MKACKVVVLCESDPHRENAKKLCNALIDRFWTRCEFDVSWFSFDDLVDLKKSAASAREAGETDVLVVACAPEDHVPNELQLWVEQWISRRTDREGSLIGLLGSQADLCSGRETYLRNVARRGGLDFLTGVPTALAGALPEDPDSVSERATRISNVLEDILQKPIAPRSFPLGKL